MVFAIIFLSLVVVTLLSVAVLRQLIVKPILNKISSTEKVVTSILANSTPDPYNCTYAEYLNKFSEIYDQIYLLYEDTLAFISKQNKKLLEFLMVESEICRCLAFNDTARLYKEKYSEHLKAATCANYYT